MNRRPRLGVLLWWSLRRAARAYGPLRAAAVPVGLALLWLLLSTAFHGDETVRRWSFRGAAALIAAVSVLFAMWRIVSDRASGAAEGLSWTAGAGARVSALCMSGACAILCGAQLALLIALIRVIGRQVG